MPEATFRQTTGHARVRVTHRGDIRRGEPVTAKQFWQRLRETDDDYSNIEDTELEGRLRHDFGGKLKNNLLNTLDRALVEPDHDLLRQLEYYFRRGREEPFSSEFLARWLESRQRGYEGSAELRSVRDKRVLAPQVWFNVRGITYSSLIFDLDFGPIDKIAAIFDNNFEAFQLFLAAYVPAAFGQTFEERFADQLEFDISVPDISSIFHRTVSQTVSAPAHSQPDAVVLSNEQSRRREQAEWLWRLANGSLLVPFLISLLVMLYAIRELSRIREQQLKAIEPIIQHQLELLKEDRLRFEQARQSPPSTSGAQGTQSTPSTQTTDTKQSPTQSSN